MKKVMILSLFISSLFAGNPVLNNEEIILQDNPLTIDNRSLESGGIKSAKEAYEDGVGIYVYGLNSSNKIDQKDYNDIFIKYNSKAEEIGTNVYDYVLANGSPKEKAIINKYLLAIANSPDTPKLFSSCKTYLAANPGAPSGTYDIDVNGKTVNVYCDMVTDGGGWTLVLHQGDGSLGNSDLSKTISTTANSSNYDNCLLEDPTNNTCIPGLVAWQDTDIIGSSYMLKGFNSTTLKFDNFIVKSSNEVPWRDILYFKQTNIDSSYLAADTSNIFSGYGFDYSSGGGCQDSSIAGYLLSIGQGNTPCGSTAFKFILSTAFNTTSGAYFNGSYKNHVYMYIR